MSQGLCPGCGAAVNLTAGQDKTKCQYCETVVMFQQAEEQFNEVKNSKFGGTLMLAENARMSGNFKVAESYYGKIIEQSPDYAEAWLYKGICILRYRESGDEKFFYNFSKDNLKNEAINSWRMAVKFAKYPEHMRKRVATEINDMMTVSLSELAKEGYADVLCLASVQLLLVAFEFDSTSLAIAKTGIKLCDLPGRWHSPGWQLSSAQDDNPQLHAIHCRLREAKSKCEQVLARLDPNYAQVIERRVRKEHTQQAADVQQKATKVQNEIKDAKGTMGCLMIVCFCLLAADMYWIYDSYVNQEIDWPESYIIPVIIALFLGAFIIKCICFFKNPTSFKIKKVDVVSALGDVAIVAGAVIEHEINKKERNKPITKGDLEDLERRMRHERELKELDDLKRRHGL